MAQTSFTGPLASGTREAGTALGPNVGLVSLSQTGTFAQNSTNVVDLTFFLPAGAQLVDILFDVTTAFDSVTSATGSVGTASGGTQYASGVNLKTAGRTRPTYTAAQLAAMADVSTNRTVVVTSTPVGATAAGAVRVTLQYVQKDGVA